MSSTLDAFKAATIALTNEDVEFILSDMRSCLGGKLLAGLEHMEKCDECCKLVDPSCFNEETEAYKNYKEDLCDDCVKFCKPCDKRYAPSATYKHEDCLYQASEDCPGHKWSDPDVDECDTCWMSKEDCDHVYDGEGICGVCESKMVCQNCKVSDAEELCAHCEDYVCKGCLSACPECGVHACCRH